MTIRAMQGESVIISGADLIEGWRRETEGGWSAPLPSKPKKMLRDGQPWSGFRYDKAKGRFRVIAGSDPWLHVFETVVRKEGIDLASKKSVKIKGVTVIDSMKAGAANP